MKSASVSSSLRVGPPEETGLYPLTSRPDKPASVTGELRLEKFAEWDQAPEAQTHTLALLGEMGSQLQTCLTLKEAYAVISLFVQRLFLEETGALYLFDAARNRLEAATAWGEPADELSELTFTPNECWALRRGRIYVAEQPSPGLRCHHVEATSSTPQPSSYLCAPLLEHGNLQGVLHLRQKPPRPEVASHSPNLNSKLSFKHCLALIVAEYVGLALAHLKLREAWARAQSAPEASPEPVTRPARLVIGALTLDSQSFEATIGEKAVRLTSVEFKLLHFLMRHARQIFSTEQLLQSVWRYPPGAGSPELVRVHIKNLRGKIEPDPCRPVFLKTINRLGYTLLPETTLKEKS